MLVFYGDFLQHYPLEKKVGILHGRRRKTEQYLQTDARLFVVEQDELQEI